MKKILLISLTCLLLFVAGKMKYTSIIPESIEMKLPPLPINKEENRKEDLITSTGATIAQRFNVPEGYRRIDVEPDSYEEYLRNLPLKPHGSEVYYYDGSLKRNKGVHEAVIDIDVGKRDLQQCADAAIRLRAEYLYGKELYDDISFQFTNGFPAEYSKWRNGYRISVEGNNAKWVKTAQPSSSYESFRKYLDIVFTYAGTLSLARELKPVEVDNMTIGDIIIKGGSPGHAVIVIDGIIHEETGEKLFLLAQSYMPAQDIHVLCNPEGHNISPWYRIEKGKRLRTPEWTFEEVKIGRFN